MQEEVSSISLLESVAGLYYRSLEQWLFLEIEIATVAQHQAQSPIADVQMFCFGASTREDTPAGGDVADASGFSPYPGNINVLAPSMNVRCRQVDE